MVPYFTPTDPAQAGVARDFVIPFSSFPGADLTKVTAVELMLGPAFEVDMVVSRFTTGPIVCGDGLVFNDVDGPNEVGWNNNDDFLCVK